jgi:hypothetical protein
MWQSSGTFLFLLWSSVGVSCRAKYSAIAGEAGITFLVTVVIITFPFSRRNWMAVVQLLWSHIQFQPATCPEAKNFLTAIGTGHWGIGICSTAYWYILAWVINGVQKNILEATVFR